MIVPSSVASILPVLVRIVGRSAIADAEIQHAVGPEPHRAAVVVRIGLFDLEDHELRVAVGQTGCDGEARQARHVSPARRIPDV